MTRHMRPRLSKVAITRRASAIAGILAAALVLTVTTASTQASAQPSPSVAAVAQPAPVVDRAKVVTSPTSTINSVSSVSSAIMSAATFWQPDPVRLPTLTANALKPSACQAVTRVAGYALKADANFIERGGYEWNGTIRNAGQIMVCVQYNAKLTCVAATASSANIPGLSPLVSREINYVNGRWLDTTGLSTAAANRQAGAVHFAVQWLIGAPAWMTAFNRTYLREQNALDPGVWPLAVQYINAAKTHYGPYTLSKPALLKPIYAGQQGTFSVRLVGASSALAGYTINWAISGGRILSSTKTDSTGTSRMTFVDTNVSLVSVSANAPNLPNWFSLVTLPAPGFQRLAGKLPVVSLTSFATVTISKPASSTITAPCLNGCNGHPTVKFCAPTNVAGGDPIQYGTNLIGTAGWSHIIQQAAGQASRCVTFGGTDGQRYQSAHRYVLGGGKYSPWVNEGRIATINCPPSLELSSVNDNTVTYVVAVSYTYTETQVNDCKCPSAQTNRITQTAPVAGPPIKGNLTVIGRRITIKSGVNVGQRTDWVIVNGVSYPVQPRHAFSMTFTMTAAITVTTKLGRVLGAPINGTSLYIPLLVP